MKTEVWKRWYVYAKENHICASCGKAKAAPGKVHCLNCLDAQAVSQMVHRAKMTEDERREMSRKNAERLRMKVKEAKEKGLCIVCFKRVPAPGKKSCPECLIKQRERSRRKREVKKWSCGS